MHAYNTQEILSTHCPMRASHNSLVNPSHSSPVNLSHGTPGQQVLCLAGTFIHRTSRHTLNHFDAQSPFVECSKNAKSSRRNTTSPLRFHSFPSPNRAQCGVLWTPAGRSGTEDSTHEDQVRQLAALAVTKTGEGPSTAGLPGAFLVLGKKNTRTYLKINIL